MSMAILLSVKYVGKHTKVIKFVICKDIVILTHINVVKNLVFYITNKRYKFSAMT